MVRAKKLIYAKQFEGMPKLTDFRIEAEDLPELKDGNQIYFSLSTKHISSDYE